MDTSHNQDDLILKQQEEIQKTIAASSDLVSDKLPLKTLEEEFANDEVYRSKIAKLSDKYSFLVFIPGSIKFIVECVETNSCCKRN